MRRKRSSLATIWALAVTLLAAPAREKADRIEEPIVAVKRDHPADAEKRRGREVIAGERHAVDEPRNLPVRRVVTAGSLPLS